MVLGLLSHLQPDPERLECYAGRLQATRQSLRPDAAGDPVGGRLTAGPAALGTLSGEAHCRSRDPGAESTGQTCPSCTVQLTLPAVRGREAQLPAGAGSWSAACFRAQRERSASRLALLTPSGGEAWVPPSARRRMRDELHTYPGGHGVRGPSVSGAGGDGGSLIALLSSFPGQFWLRGSSFP